MSRWQGVKQLSSLGNIRLKRMGELDTTPFFEAIKKRYNRKEVEERVLELCSLWEEHLTNPDWHPFKVIMVEGKEKVPVKHIDLLKLSWSRRASLHVTPDQTWFTLLFIYEPINILMVFIL